MDKNEVIVKLENYSKNYGLKKIIKNLNLEVYKGEFLTLLGPSGCGKTTILRSIAGFDEPSSGKIFLDNKDITKLPPNKRPINTLFQNYALFPNMTVYENIEFGLKMKKIPLDERQKKIKDIIKTVNLEGFENKKPSELSGGQQQRVSIARGIINNPKVLLLDEPLSALDLKLRKKMQIDLKILQKKLGITFIYVTHNQEEALTMSDRIAIINNHKIEQIDTPQNIYKYPKTKFVAEFIGESNIFEAKVIEVESNTIIETKEGFLFKIKNNNYEKNEMVYLVIRPEDFIIANQHQKYNQIECNVVENIYNGSDTKCILETQNKQNIMVIIDNNLCYPINEKLYLNCDIENLIVIRKEQ